MILLSYSPYMNSHITLFYSTQVTIWWQAFHFWVSCPFKCAVSDCVMICTSALWTTGQKALWIWDAGWLVLWMAWQAFFSETAGFLSSLSFFPSPLYCHSSPIAAWWWEYDGWHHTARALLWQEGKGGANVWWLLQVWNLGFIKLVNHLLLELFWNSPSALWTCFVTT